MTNTFSVLKDDGTTVICDLLFTFDSEETNKSYIVYTDNTRDDNGNINVFASIYDPTLDDLKLEPIQSEGEWEVIENILNMLQEQIRAQYESYE